MLWDDRWWIGPGRVGLGGCGWGYGSINKSYIYFEADHSVRVRVVARAGRIGSVLVMRSAVVFKCINLLV